MEEDLNFDIEITDSSLTCGWLISEVTRRYTEKIQELKSKGMKRKKKLIVAVKTIDEIESLDYWLT